MAVDRIRETSWIFSEAARTAMVPVELVRAIVSVESDFDPWACRYEPDYKWILDWPDCAGSMATELYHQRTSWGLMQIMGATARWLGYQEPWLSMLLDARVNLVWGCRYLREQLARNAGAIPAAVAGYNAGTARRTPAGNFINQRYVDKVVLAMKRQGYTGNYVLEGFGNDDPDN